MNKYQILFSPSARRDLEDIFYYRIDTLENPFLVEHFQKELLKELDLIKMFPYANVEYIPWKKLKYSYRKAKVENYFMFYYVNEKEKIVIIVRFVYQKRDLNALILS